MMERLKIHFPATAICVCLLGLALYGCKDGASSGSKLPTDGIFGDLPAIINDFGEQSIGLFEAVINTEDEKEMMELLGSKREAIDSTTKAALKVAFEKLGDKEFPTDVSAEVPLKVITPFKIVPEKSKDEGLFFSAEVENTGKIGVGKDMFRISHIYVMFIDKDGQPLCTLKDHSYIAEDALKISEIGSRAHITTKVKFTPWNAEWLSHAAKFLIVDYKSDFFKQANDTTKAAEWAYQKKTLELATELMKKVSKKK